MSTATLTTTQHSALGDLQRRGFLLPGREAFDYLGQRAYSARTLTALVAAGHAVWDTQNVATEPGCTAIRSVIVPNTDRWSILIDADGDPHTLCPCGGQDTIQEVDKSVRWNSLTLTGLTTATASCGDGDYHSDGWVCDTCGNRDLAAPEGFTISEWY